MRTFNFNLFGFRGLYDRGGGGITPSRFSSRFENLLFDGDVVRERNSFIRDTDFPVAITSAVGFKPADEVLSRILYVAGSSGELFTSAGHSRVTTIPGCEYFSAQVYGGRLYVSPHNRSEGLSGQFVYVWNGVDSFRKAGGDPPSDTFNVVETQIAGRLRPGVRMFALVYVTDSGFTTKPGPSVYPTINLTGNSSVRLSNIPAGPSHVVRRFVLATKQILDPDVGVLNGVLQGNQDAYEFFYCPGGRIDNNDDDVSIDLSFYDEELIDSANDLFLQQNEIKAGLGLCDFNGRLCVWGADGENNVIRVSRINNPESFSALDGFIVVDPQDVNGVKNCWPFRDGLYINKSQQTFITADNGDAPSSWPVGSVDLGIGAEVDSVSTINDTKGLNLDYTLIATRQGVLLFNGVYQHPEVSWNVESFWKTIPGNNFNSVRVLHDPAQRRVYINAPFGDNRRILVCDYDLGWDSPRWMLWSFEDEIQGMIIQDGDLWVYGDGGLYKEEERDPQVRELSGLLPIEFEIGPLKRDDTHYNHQPLVIDNLKIESGFYSIRQFDQVAAPLSVTIPETDGKIRLQNYAIVRKGILRISALGRLSFTSMQTKLVEQWMDGVV